MRENPLKRMTATVTSQGALNWSLAPDKREGTRKQLWKTKCREHKENQRCRWKATSSDREVQGKQIDCGQVQVSSPLGNCGV